MTISVVNAQAFGYTGCAAEKKAAGFGTPKLRVDNRYKAVVFCPIAFVRLLQWAGLGGDGFGRTGLFRTGFQPRQVPALPFGTGKRLTQRRRSA